MNRPTAAETETKIKSTIARKPYRIVYEAVGPWINATRNAQGELPKGATEGVRFVGIERISR